MTGVGESGGAQPHVVLVDDDRALLRVYTAYLEDAYRVSAHDNPVRAVEAIQAGGVDLVISDIQMPALDGLALRHRLSAAPETDIVPFIFLSAQDGELIKDRAALLGIDDYLVKPLRKAELRRVADRVLRRSARVRARIGDRLDQSITECLRPALPDRLGSWRTATMARSASAGGGDFVHLRSHGSSHTVLLGDAMGHGEQAKFFAHAHAGFLHGLLCTLDGPLTPVALLARISEAMRLEPVLKSAMISCLVAALGDDGVVRLAAAGHPPPLVASRGDVERVDVGGLLPGLISDYRYAERSVALAPGGRLLLHTDGLFDAPGAAQPREATEAEIIKILRVSSDASIDVAAARLASCFDRSVTAGAEDDATFVLVERG